MRTDLAEEAQALWTRQAGQTSALAGVKARQWTENGVRRHRVQILDRQGEKALGKPAGVYETMWIPPDCRPTPEAVQTLGDILSSLLALKPDTSVLVVGLGNRAMTPDAIGPWTVSGLLVTRHLHRQMPGLFGDMRPVSALEPGVLGTTGMESAEIVKSVIHATGPDRVLVVDALAAAGPDRLCQVLQVTDAGIVPGSGVGNSRAAFSARTLGAPVVAVGAPTVLDAGQPGEPMLVTPRDVDAKVRRLSRLILAGIHRALFPRWSDEEIAQCVE